MSRIRVFCVFVLMLGVAAAIGVALGGPFTDQGTQPGLTYPLNASVRCVFCHGDDYDGANDIEPYDTWAGSMMAQSSRDPLFWAALDVANNDVPGIGDWCLRCHVSKGWLAGRSEPPGGSVDGCALEGQIDSPQANDFEGVTCHLCHRMMVNPSPPDGEEPLYYENAQYWIDDEPCPGSTVEPCRRGPYDYDEPGLNAPPHVWQYSALHESSDLCANCHNVTSPVKTLKIGGADTGIPFPVERTFDEWQQSAYAQPGPTHQTCQNCHMPDATADPAYACAFLTNNHTGNMPVHRFAGGNAWVPEVLRQEYPSLNIDNQLAAARDAALDMLQNQSALVELTLSDSEAEPGGTVDATVKITNLTGHKLPTGYPEGRRMWIQLRAIDAGSDVVWESGAYDAATGVLTKDPAIKVYESKQGVHDFNGTGTCDVADGVGSSIFHFALNDCVVKDNRIPPQGFTGGGDIETAPVGYTYPETSPGSGILVHWDETGYTIPIPANATSPVTIVARLLYQTTSKDYVEFLLDEANDNGFPDDCIERTDGLPGKSRAEVLYDMWNAYGKAAPVEMGSAQGQVTLVAGGTPGEASAAEAAPMEVVAYDGATGEVTISFEPACLATDHTIYEGDLTTVAALNYDSQVCGVGTSGAASFVPAPGNRFWLVVGHDGSVEGSYGIGGDGLERPEAATLPTCDIPQDLTQRCDP